MPDGKRLNSSLDLLKRHYPQVTSLQGYIYSVLSNAAETTLVTPDDPEGYRDLLENSRVGYHQLPSRKYRAGATVFEIDEVIKRAQWCLLRLPSAAKNIITAGYKVAREGNSVDLEKYGIVNVAINTIVSALRGETWVRLLSRLGEDVLLHLLTGPSIFVPLPNGCLCQVTGEHMYNLAQILQSPSPSLPAAPKRKASEVVEGELRPLKQRRLDDSGRSKKKRGPVNVTLSRLPLFYARPNVIPHTSVISVCLPKKHVLNQINPSGPKLKTDPRKATDQGPQSQLEGARLLVKFIFPRQHGLPNPFTASTEKAVPFHDREIEAAISAGGFVKTPKRINGALDLFEKLVWRHGKCGYKPLLNEACPSKIGGSVRKADILQYMSEGSSQLFTQPLFPPDDSVYSDGITIIGCGLTQEKKNAANKPRFVDFACSHSEVTRYVVMVTEEVIPNALWGGKENFEIIKRYIREFIQLRRYETMSLHHVLQDLKISKCKWLGPECTDDKPKKYTSVTDSLKRREIFEEFVFWYFNSFLLPLLSSAFYATESTRRHHVAYFRQDDWKTLCAPLIEHLAEQTFKRISDRDAKEILSQRKLGYSYVRLLPKEAGVRPIVNLRRAPKGGSGRQDSINRILGATFEVLTYEKTVRPELTGDAVFGPDEIHKKLKEYKFRLCGGNVRKPLPKLYFVKLDVRACFDTIDQTKLLQIMRDALSDDEYTIRRFGVIRTDTGNYRKRWLKKAFSSDDLEDFVPYAIELAGTLKNTILVDQLPYHYQRREELMQLLDEHITENIVKIEGQYYRQVVGIPQGSVLSSLLCSFAYGDLERRKFKFSQDQESVLLRLVDDYLLITTNYLKATTFLEMMMKGNPEYGCFVSPEKTRTNFSFGSDPSMVTEPDQQGFPWCGYLINMSDLSITADYSRYPSTYIKDSMTVHRGKSPGIAFANKMMQLAKYQVRAIYCDLELNPPRCVYFNLYTGLLLCGMKMHEHIRTSGIVVPKSTKLILDTINHVIGYTFSTAKAKSISSRGEGSTSKDEISKKRAEWLGAYAFHQVLSRKRELYHEVTNDLSKRISGSEHKALKREFGATVRDGLAEFKNIAF